jgi:hypothetical protein
MSRKAALTLIFALAAAPFLGCSRSPGHGPKASLSGNYFPLGANSTWTYKVDSKSQRAHYTVTDRVIGHEFVRALNMAGDVVQETYTMSRGGARPIVYYLKGGYLSRLSGLSYSNREIVMPAWGRSEESNFLPASLAPDSVWSNKILPFGHMPGAFDIAQTHHSYLESKDVVVPAGHFKRCIRVETRAQYEGGSYGKVGMGIKLAYVDWYAPDVGLVKTLALEGGPKGPVMEQVVLISYEVGKPTNGATTVKH